MALSCKICGCEEVRGVVEGVYEPLNTICVGGEELSVCTNCEIQILSYVREMMIFADRVRIAAFKQNKNRSF